jgi:hypothetical protein
MEEVLERIHQTLKVCEWDEVLTDLVDLAEKVDTERIRHRLKLFEEDEIEPSDLYDDLYCTIHKVRSHPYFWFKYVTEITPGFYSFQECTVKDTHQKYKSISFDVMTMVFKFSDGGYTQARW